MTFLFRRILPATILVALAGLIAFRIAAFLREDTPYAADLPAGGQIIDTDLGGMFVLAQGKVDAPLVLFSHGTAAWSGLWAPTLKAISAQGYHAVAFDMPPFGFSQHSRDRDYSRQGQAKRVLALLDALPSRPIIVAHSVSAAPMSEAIMARPEKVAGLIIVAGALGLDSHTDPAKLPLPLRPPVLREAAVAATASNPLLTKIFLRGFMHVKSAANAETTAILRKPMRRTGYTAALSDWLPALLVPPTDAESTRPQNWATLQVPTALIWGDKDTVTPLDQAQTLDGLLPSSHLTVLPGVGHIPQLESPDAFQQALLAALKTFDPDTAELR